MTDRGPITLFLCGDVMTGRGVDQILPHPVPPHLFERYATSALDYVALAERVHGPIPRPVDYAYVWGRVPEVLERMRPAARIINLETSVTTSGEAVPKGINYRMHPRNIPVLEAAGIDCCVLANNHVLDWGEAGLLETLETLARAGIHVAGAGEDLRAARAPAVLEVRGGRRVLVFAFGATDSGIPGSWAAAPGRPGVHLLPDLSDETADDVAGLVSEAKRPADVAVASVHWGGNWGFEIPAAHRHFAHALIDRARIDVVHGHSSHHIKAIEVYGQRPIFYGCGDFLTDYEGIGGIDDFRDDLGLMYFPTLDDRTGRLVRLEMVPLQTRGFRLHRPSRSGDAWLRETLERECGRFGHGIARRGEAFVLE